MNEIWIVDDDESIRWVLEKALTRDNFRVRSFVQVPDVLEALSVETPRVLLTDIRMPGPSGFRLLEHVRNSHPNLPVIIMTAFTDLDSAVTAFQGGAYEYLPKPFDLKQALELIRRAVREHDVPPPSEPPVVAHAEDMLGQAPAMQEVFRAIGRLAQSTATVLVTGESGSGKELVARALHQHSVRAQQPFVALNMAAIPRDLLESELFGHDRGAFTGAQSARRGRFEQAEGGTLFLDEIGDMPAEMQTRLLRVLSDGHFYRVGGQQPIRSHVRVIAATHQNLEDRVRRGLFREDLFHRLNVIRLRLPSLRERREDIALLARHFLARAAQDLGGEPKRLSADALAGLERFDWPGNVRQLENVCNWLTVMAPGQRVSADDLPEELKSASATAASAGGGAVTAAGAGVVGSGPSEEPLGMASGDPVVGSPGEPWPGNGSGQVRYAADAAVPSGSAGREAQGGTVDTATTTAAWARQDAGQGSGRSGSTGSSGAQALQSTYGTQSAPAEGLAGWVAPGSVRGAAAASVRPQDWHTLLAQEVLLLMRAESERGIEGMAAALDQAGVTGAPVEGPSDEGSAGRGLMESLARTFESTVIRSALQYTRGRRVEAAQRLGIGRNTISRKIQDLGLDGEHH